MSWLQPQAQLDMACRRGDLLSAKLAVRNGANVNSPDAPGQWRGPGARPFPLQTALSVGDFAFIAWLLSVGADPDTPGVMASGALACDAQVLQLLVDMGGSVNALSEGRPPLFWALSRIVRVDTCSRAAVLLAHPDLDLCEMYYKGKSPERHARECGELAAADMVEQEVRQRAKLCERDIA